MNYAHMSEGALLKKIVTEELYRYEAHYGKAICPKAKSVFMRKIFRWVLLLLLIIAGTVALFTSGIDLLSSPYISLFASGIDLLLSPYIVILIIVFIATFSTKKSLNRQISILL